MAHNTNTPSPHWAAHAPWAVGPYSTCRKACRSRATGIKRGGHGLTKVVPPTFRGVDAIMPYHKIRGPGECFACDCAHPLANSGATNTGDTGAPEGDLPQREKNTHPPPLTDFCVAERCSAAFERGDQGSQSLFQARARRDDGTFECSRRLRRTFGRWHGATRKWRHCLAPSVSAPPGPPRIFFEADTPVTLGHQPNKTKFYCGKL